MCGHLGSSCHKIWTKDVPRCRNESIPRRTGPPQGDPQWPTPSLGQWEPGRHWNEWAQPGPLLQAQIGLRVALQTSRENPKTSEGSVGQKSGDLVRKRNLELRGGRTQNSPEQCCLMVTRGKLHFSERSSWVFLPRTAWKQNQNQREPLTHCDVVQLWNPFQWPPKMPLPKQAWALL